MFTTNITRSFYSRYYINITFTIHYLFSLLRARVVCLLPCWVAPVPILKPPAAGALKLGVANGLACGVPNVGVPTFGADGTPKVGVEGWLLKLNEVWDGWSPNALGALFCAKTNTNYMALILSWHKSGLNPHVVFRRHAKALE